MSSWNCRQGRDFSLRIERRGLPALDSGILTCRSVKQASNASQSFRRIRGIAALSSCWQVENEGSGCKHFTERRSAQCWLAHALIPFSWEARYDIGSCRRLVRLSWAEFARGARTCEVGMGVSICLNRRCDAGSDHSPVAEQARLGRHGRPSIARG
jgi:hypothetical protein